MGRDISISGTNIAMYCSHLQIDITTIQAMNDRELSGYVTAFSDIVELRQLCGGQKANRK